MKPQPVDQVTMVFGGGAMKLLPPWSEIPDEFKSRHNKWSKTISKWFFSGLPKETQFVAKDGIDGKDALRHIGTCMRSWEPKHEHKEAGCAYLLSLWFDDVIIPESKATP